MDRLYINLLKLRLIRVFNSQTSPRWLVALIDVLLIFISYLVVGAFDFKKGDFALFDFWLIKAGVFVGVFVLMMVVFKSYAFIIRLSVIEDLQRIFMVAISSTTIILLLNFVVYLMSNIVFYGCWNVLFVGCLSLTLMLLMRMTVKYLHLRISEIKRNRKNVIVLGTSLKSLLFANALHNEINGKYEPIAILSLNNKKTDKKINGFNVEHYSHESIGGIFRMYEAEALVYTRDLDNVVRTQLSAALLENGISLLQFNPLE